jgi:hypothetical protein
MAGGNPTYDEKLEEKMSASNSEPNSEMEPQSKEFAPISSRHDRSRTGSQSRQSASIKSLHRTRSHNGYGCDDPEDNKDVAEQNMERGGEPKEDPFEVSWEGGESDPMNPRSMSGARKWLVVLIVSASSLCV